MKRGQYCNRTRSGLIGTYIDADGLVLRGSSGDDLSLLRAPVVEELGEGSTDDIDIVSGDAERGGGEANLLDEVSNLVHVQAHELVNIVHAGLAVVGWEAILAKLGASKQEAEVRVQVGQESAEEDVRQLRLCLGMKRGLTTEPSCRCWKAGSSIEEQLRHRQGSSLRHQRSRHRWWNRANRQSTAGG